MVNEKIYFSAGIEKSSSILATEPVFFTTGSRYSCHITTLEISVKTIDAIVGAGVQYSEGVTLLEARPCIPVEDANTERHLAIAADRHHPDE